MRSSLGFCLLGVLVSFNGKGGYRIVTTLLKELKGTTKRGHTMNVTNYPLIVRVHYVIKQ